MSLFKDAIERAKSFLHLRKQAYVHTFNPESVFARRVLLDLAKFCRAERSTFHPDERMHAVLEGRREVWLRIVNHLEMTPEEIWKQYGRNDLE